MTVVVAGPVTQGSQSVRSSGSLQGRFSGTPLMTTWTVQSIPARTVHVSVGAALGLSDGANVGEVLGEAVGVSEGLSEGVNVGLSEGDAVGVLEGLSEGEAVGVLEGLVEGVNVGLSEGEAVGVLEGLVEGVNVGLSEGDAVGVSEGLVEGVDVGTATGEAVGVLVAGRGSSQEKSKALAWSMQSNNTAFLWTYGYLTASMLGQSLAYDLALGLGVRLGVLVYGEQPL